MPVRAVSGALSKSGRARIGNATRVRGYSTPPPVGGWNARDSLEHMPETDAVTLDNWYPEETHCRVRRGHDDHVTGFAAEIETLMSWRGLASSKLFAAAGTAIYDATSAGAVGAAVVSTTGNARWQHVMYSTSAANYLVLCNGAVDPYHYNGTTWTQPAISGSGLTVANLIHVHAFKKRLFFIEKDTLYVWYLPTDAVAGTLTKIDLGPHCLRGGYLMAMGTMTFDAGDGVDDAAVFVTSEGEVIIFQGVDPNSVSTWQMVGRYEIAAPIGRRCLIKYGGDLLVITDDGFHLLSRYILSGRTGTKTSNLSDKISHAVHDAVTDYRANFGWQPIFYPKGQWLVVNIPRSSAGNSAYQFVMNPDTGAWCRFTNMNANCWEVHDDDLYFGGETAVFKADTGLSDNGEFIPAVAKPAFSHFGAKHTNKRISMVRPFFETDGAITVGIRVNVDYEDVDPSGASSFTPDEGSTWDTAEWDVAEWGTDPTIQKKWLTVFGIGHVATIKMTADMENGSLNWHGTDFKIEDVRSAGYL